MSSQTQRNLRTDRNLWTAFMEEAKANLMYIAYAQKAMQEGHPEVAETFMEAAGAETIHALSHLSALKEVKSTLENLQAVTEGEAYELEVMYPQMIEQANAEGRHEAASSFHLAHRGEKHHVEMFKAALEGLKAKLNQPVLPPPTAINEEERQAAIDLAQTPDVYEHLEGQKQRVASLSRIREVVFGMQDGLLSTAALGASVAGAVTDNDVVIIAGLAAAVAGMLSMAAGTFLGGRAQAQVYSAELRKEAEEIEANPAEEMAELIAIYRQEGYSFEEATEMAERVAADREKWLEVMAVKELGLIPEASASTNPYLDAGVMGVSYIIGGVIPLIPYFFMEGDPAIALSVGLAATTLFGMGAIKGVLVQRSPLLQGLEIMIIGSVVAAIGYLLGIAFPTP